MVISKVINLYSKTILNTIIQVLKVNNNDLNRKGLLNRELKLLSKKHHLFKGHPCNIIKHHFKDNKIKIQLQTQYLYKHLVFKANLQQRAHQFKINSYRDLLLKRLQHRCLNHKCLPNKEHDNSHKYSNHP
jgi:hypothetical protein